MQRYSKYPLIYSIFSYFMNYLNWLAKKIVHQQY